MVKKVMAVGTAASSLSGRSDLADAIQTAMAKAVEDALSEGVSDPDEIKARMLAAREAVKAGG